MSEFIQLSYKSKALEQSLRHRVKEKKILVRHGNIAITDYHKGDNWEFEKSLSVWDPTRFKYTMVGGYYIKELKEFRVNRGYSLARLHEFFPHHKIEVVNDAIPSDKIKVKLFAPPRNDIQRVTLTFMASEGIYKKNHKYTQQLIELPTGQGKTYCGSASISFLSAKTVVIVPFSKLLDQWRDSILNFTSIKKDEILIVQGKKTCKKIIEDKYPDVKVFIFMVDTIASFKKSNGNLAVMDLFYHTHAYTKIVDEVHLDMKALSMIEALSNFHMNYYMSATAGRTEHKEDWIFKNLFYNIPKFGSNFINQDEKYLNVLIKYYQFFPTNKQINKMVNNKVGLNSMLYEKVLVHADEQQQIGFNSSLCTILKWTKNLLPKGNKVLILAQTIDFLEYIQKQAETVYTGQTALYHGQLSSKEREKALEADVIIATIGTLGTGADIQGIQFLINCTTYSSKITANQISGRCRQLPNGEQSCYIELVNNGWKKTMNQFLKREHYLRKKTKTGKLLIVN